MWIDPLSKRWLDKAGAVPVEQGRGPVVLMYHAIEPPGMKPPSVWAVPANNFYSQMSLLKKAGWTTLRVSDLFKQKVFPDKSVVLTFDDGFENNFDYGFKILADLGMTATWFMVTKDIDGYSSWLDPGQPDRPMLSRTQILEMSQAGMEIAAHSLNHKSLVDLPHSQVLHEMRQSKEDLERLLKKEVVSFAYPFGRFNETCLSAIAESGFKIACTTRPGWFGSDPDLFKVRRVAVFSHDSLSSLARKLAFADTEIGWPKMANYAVDRLLTRLRPKG